jgi:hypothetical protein
MNYNLRPLIRQVVAHLERLSPNLTDGRLSVPYTADREAQVSVVLISVCAAVGIGHCS